MLVRFVSTEPRWELPYKILYMASYCKDSKYGIKKIDFYEDGIYHVILNSYHSRDV